MKKFLNNTYTCTGKKMLLISLIYSLIETIIIFAVLITTDSNFSLMILEKKDISFAITWILCSFILFCIANSSMILGILLGKKNK